MLPAFDDFGYLPPGIHPATLAEVVDRFGSGSPEREVETHELVDFLQWCRQSGVQRVIINGSYVTARISPNDVDVVILSEVERDPEVRRRLAGAVLSWPFLQILIAVDEQDLERWAMEDFATDRALRKKGVVEIRP